MIWIYTVCKGRVGFIWVQQVLIVLGFNDTSTLEGHFVSSPREREKRDKKRE